MLSANLSVIIMHEYVYFYWARDFISYYFYDFAFCSFGSVVQHWPPVISLIRCIKSFSYSPIVAELQLKVDYPVVSLNESQEISRYFVDTFK